MSFTPKKFGRFTAPREEATEPKGNLGELLGGRLSHISIDSVEAVREIREGE